MVQQALEAARRRANRLSPNGVRHLRGPAGLKHQALSLDKLSDQILDFQIEINLLKSLFCGKYAGV